MEALCQKQHPDNSCQSAQVCFQWAARATYVQAWALVTLVWHILPRSDFQAYWMLPDLFPLIPENVTQRNEVALTGDDGAVRFDGHVYPAGTATLDSQLKLKRVHLAVLGGRVPSELHTQLTRLVTYPSENRL